MSLISQGIEEAFRRLDLTTDSRPVAYVRAIVGVAALLRAQEAWSILSQVLVAPLRLPYVPGVPDLPVAGLPLLIGLWVLVAGAFAVGWKTRISGSLLAVILGYVLILDQQSYSNHLFLLFLVVGLLTIADSGATFSLDARKSGQRLTIPAWPVTLMKLQLSLIYFLGAIAKLTAPSYIDGSLLALTLHPAQIAYLNTLSADTRGVILLVLGLIGVGIELFLAVGFWLPRLRRLSVVIGLALHAFMSFAYAPVVATQIQIFAIISCSLYLLFFTFPVPSQDVDKAAIKANKTNPPKSFV